MRPKSVHSQCILVLVVCACETHTADTTSYIKTCHTGLLHLLYSVSSLATKDLVWFWGEFRLSFQKVQIRWPDEQPAALCTNNPTSDLCSHNHHITWTSKNWTCIVLKGWQLVRKRCSTMFGNPHHIFFLGNCRSHDSWVRHCCSMQMSAKIRNYYQILYRTIY